jgi:hypothetical protein
MSGERVRVTVSAIDGVHTIVIIGEMAAPGWTAWIDMPRQFVTSLSYSVAVADNGEHLNKRAIAELRQVDGGYELHGLTGFV